MKTPYCLWIDSPLPRPPCHISCIPSLKVTCSHLNINGFNGLFRWNLLLGWPIFRGKLAVSFRVAYIHWFFIDFRGWRSGVIPCSLHSYESLLQKKWTRNTQFHWCDDGRETDAITIAVCDCFRRFLLKDRLTSKQKKTCLFEKQTGVSFNGGTPKSSILIGFSIINHPFWGTHIFWKHLL